MSLDLDPSLRIAGGDETVGQSIRLDASWDERTYKGGASIAFGAAVVGYGASIEAKLVIADSFVESGINVTGKLYFGGVATEKLGRWLSGAEPLGRRTNLGRRIASVSAGPSAWIEHSLPAKELVSEGEFTEFQILPLTITPRDTNDQWGVQLGDSWGLGGAVGKQYRLDISLLTILKLLSESIAPSDDHTNADRSRSSDTDDTSLP